jgi:hypothetical protein
VGVGCYWGGRGGLAVAAEAGDGIRGAGLAAAGVSSHGH